MACIERIRIICCGPLDAVERRARALDVVLLDVQEDTSEGLVYASLVLTGFNLRRTTAWFFSTGQGASRYSFGAAEMLAYTVR